MTTTRLVEWFEKEAGAYLSMLERALDGLAGDPDALGRARSAARALAGSARLAGEDRVHAAATALDAGLRASHPDAGGIARLADDVRLSLDDLRYLLGADAPANVLDARAASVAARWADVAATAESPAEPTATHDFAAFVARESEAVAEVMERGISAFGDDPSNRESLGSILRRQRALLGSARLDEYPVVAEALQAVEDLCELIVRLDVPVKSEWLDVFRSAREVLRAAGETIERGEEPGQTPALSRLRTLREELVARYGERIAAQPVEAEPEPATDRAPDPTVDPRQRAVVLRARIAQALGDAPEPREALDELYGLLLSALR